jgi:hypothetical protein
LVGLLIFAFRIYCQVIFDADKEVDVFFVPGFVADIAVIIIAFTCCKSIGGRGCPSDCPVIGVIPLVIYI